MDLDLNEKHIDNSSVCRIDWIDDGWCDNHCRTSESCFYDANDCSCDPDSDSTAMDGTYVTVEGFYTLWQIIPAYYPELEEQLAEYNNCTEAFCLTDTNNDSHVDVHEFIVIADEFFLVLLVFQYRK